MGAVGQSVKVQRICKCMQYSTLHRIKSRVYNVLCDGVGMTDCHVLCDGNGMTECIKLLGRCCVL